MKNEYLKDEKVSIKKNWLSILVPKSKFEKIFWATILLLFSVTITLYFLTQNSDFIPQNEECKICPIIDDGSDVMNENLRIESQAINNKITQVANDLINTNNVDKFLDFHYSVAGEYIELGMGAVGKIQQTINKKLFGDGFKQREKDSLNEINEQFKISIDKHAAFISSLILKDIDDKLNNEALKKLKTDIQYRKNIQIGKAGVLATTALVSTIITKISIKTAKSAAFKLTVKTAGKIAAKGGLAATVGSVGIFCGPYVWICSPALAIIAWFGADYIIIKLDEHWHRKEFKQEIITLINSGKDSFIKQYSEIYIKRLREFSEETKKIYIDSDLKIKDRVNRINRLREKK